MSFKHSNFLQDSTPCHLIYPESAMQNARTWNQKLKNQPIGKIYFAVKSCKSVGLMRAFTQESLGADVSSIEEYQHALSCGTGKAGIVMTGPFKSNEELRFCIENDGKPVIDNLDEWDQLKNLISSTQKCGDIDFRYRPTFQAGSRFGMTRSQIEIILKDKRFFERFKNIGLAFHLNGYSLKDRVNGIKECLSIQEQNPNIKWNSIDIGGGIPSFYILNDFDKNTWQDKKFEDFYPYNSKLYGADFVNAICQHQVAGKTIAQIFKEKNILLNIQPGRSLLDQCGDTFFSVRGVKEHDQDTSIAILDGMSFSLSETWFNSDFLPEPLVIQNNKIFNSKNHGYKYVFVGCSCLERDVIRWHFVHTSTRIKRGDIISFKNTAGYQMDSNESPFHLKKLPREYLFSPDHCYSNDSY